MVQNSKYVVTFQIGAWERGEKLNKQTDIQTERQIYMNFNKYSRIEREKNVYFATELLRTKHSEGGLSVL